MQMTSWRWMLHKTPLPWLDSKKKVMDTKLGLHLMLCYSHTIGLDASTVVRMFGGKAWPPILALSTDQARPDSVRSSMARAHVQFHALALKFKSVMYEDLLRPEIWGSPPLLYKATAYSFQFLVVTHSEPN